MKIVILDSDTLGKDLDLAPFKDLGDTDIYEMTLPEEIPERIKEADVIIMNKVRLTGEILSTAENLKIVCIAATGFDNIDTEYCKNHNIAVCNVRGYSTKSVALVTIAMAMSLYIHLPTYNSYAKSEKYIGTKMPTCVYPPFGEAEGRVWGIVGLGNIGRETAKMAEALGFDVIGYSRSPKDGFEMTDIDTLCRKADIISLHLPLNAESENIINAERIAMMKKNAVIINVARGKVIDENAVSEAILNEKIGGFGCDVYSVEPPPVDHPYNKIKNLENVCLTPHMAWGAVDARERCRDEIIMNINAFFDGKERNRVV